MYYYIRMTQTDSKKDYIRSAEAAEILGVSSVTITRWVEKGSIKDAYKINPEFPNSRLMIARHEVERILNLRKGEGS